MEYFRFFIKGVKIGMMHISHLIDNALFKISLMANNVSFGKNVNTYNAIPKLVISIKSKSVSFGANVTFNNYSDHSWNSKCAIYVREGAILSIGDFSGMNGTMIYAADRITIGKNVKIGGGSRIFDTNHHNLNYVERRDAELDLNAKTSPIVIEDDVFVGANCIICKGVTVGARTIIAAGSVVNKSIPSDCIAGGNPCQIIKKIPKLDI